MTARALVLIIAKLATRDLSSAWRKLNVARLGLFLTDLTAKSGLIAKEAPAELRRFNLYLNQATQCDPTKPNSMIVSHDCKCDMLMAPIPAWRVQGNDGSLPDHRMECEGPIIQYTSMPRCHLAILLSCSPAVLPCCQYHNVRQVLPWHYIYNSLLLLQLEHTPRYAFSFAIPV